jgi:hypothetical protein
MGEALTGDPEGPFTPASVGGSRSFLDKAPATIRSVGQFGSAAISVAGLEVPMGNKDKGGSHTKKVAAKSLKEKRAAKKAKKSS